MSSSEAVCSPEMFRFFKELSRNNRKVWMDENRERYQTAVVEPLRRLLEALTPFVVKLDSRMRCSGRGNFSRINRDIRFAKDKTPYRPQMYLKFPALFSADSDAGELYVGVAAQTVTIGFRIYAGGKRKESAVAQLAEPRARAKPAWIAQQKKRLARRYESYWYASEKGRWTKKKGWPAGEDWKKLHGWVVRRTISPRAAARPAFRNDVEKTFRELFPLLQFTSLRN